jgi:acetate kinase
MKLLTLNAGSGSQRCTLFELPDGALPTEPLEPIWEAKLDSTAPDQPEGKLVVKVTRGGEDAEAGMVEESASVAERMEYSLRMLWKGPAKLVRGPDEVEAIGHRIVHGGRSLIPRCALTRESKLPSSVSARSRRCTIRTILLAFA